MNWGDGSKAQNVTVSGHAEPGNYFLAEHTYKLRRTTTYKITATAESVTGGCTIVSGSYSFTLVETCEALGSGSTPDYCIPASWDTGKASAPALVKKIAPYVEPLNVIISARSDVPLGDIEKALGNWATVTSKIVDIKNFRIYCISGEKADVTGEGYVGENEAWRLQGCKDGNKLSEYGRENHVRIWNQPVKGSKYGAWFITASYETLCVSFHGKLKPAVLPDGSVRVGFPFHCVDGGPGSYLADGYNRGAGNFAGDVLKAAHRESWNVRERIVSRPIAIGKDIGEDGVKFDAKVYVLTVNY